MADNIIIRKANESDLDDILKLIAMPAIDNGTVMESLDGKAVYHSILDDPNYFQIVAATEEHIVAYITLVIVVQMTHEGSTTALITDLIVSDSIADKQAQTDIASDLLEFTISLAQEYGCYKTIVENDYLPELTATACKTFEFNNNSQSFIRK